MPAAHHLLDWLARYGTPVLFFAQMLGIFGLPIPDELLLTIAGALVRKGEMNGPGAVIAAVAGCMAGITISYVLGRTVGMVTLRRVAHLPDESFARAQSWFRRFGRWLLAFGYFIPGVRHVTAIAAGSAPLEFQVFCAYAYPGAVLWSLCFLGLGYFAGDRWREMSGVLHGHVKLVGAAVAVLVAGYVVAAARLRPDP